MTTAAGPLRTLLAAVALLLPPAAGYAQDQPFHHEPPPAKQVVIFGGGNDFPPYEFLDDDGQPAGFDVDIVKAVARVMGFKPEIRITSWQNARNALREHEVDALQGMFQMPERTGEYSFSMPYWTVGQAIFARRGVPQVSTLAELADKKLTVHRGSVMNDQLRLWGKPEGHLFVDTPADALRQLAQGNADYAVLPYLPGMHLLTELGLPNVSAMVPAALSYGYGFAVNKGDEKTLDLLNEGLNIIQKTGELQTIRDRWLGVEGQQVAPWRIALKYAAYVLVPLLLVLAVVTLWTRMLYRQVAVRTADLQREIAQRRAAEESLIQHQQQLVQAGKMAALGVLVSGVAHEINNPNGLILLNVPILRRMFGDLLPAVTEKSGEGADIGGIPEAEAREAIPRMIDDIQVGAQRIRRIVNDLKDFARVDDAGNTAPVRINDVVETAIRLIAPSIRKATHRFAAHLGEDLPSIQGNFQRLEQVLINLLLNACQALPNPECAVSVTTAFDPTLGRVTIEVRDEGAGIAPENLTRLTEPFFTTKRDRGGTGLGLSISFGIIKAHGGKIMFDSVEGKGTRVTVSLPVADSGAQS